MHVSGIPVDLYPLLQFVFTAILIALGLLHLVKRTASKYFVVDASFDEGGEAAAAAAVVEGREKRREQMVGAAFGGGTGGVCAVCGNLGRKQCSGCKAVRYCSINCQSEHWKAEHKLKCKEFALNSRKNLVSCVGNTTPPQIKKVLFPYEEFVKLFNWETPGYPPCGLLNCGNSCFANVVLQCLSCTRPLVAYMFEKDHRRDCRRNDWCFLCELQIHVQRARQSLQPFSPLNILSRLPNIGGNLGYGKQEDAHEFMRFAIDTMQSVCLDEFGGEKSLHPTSQETTLIHYIFGGQLQSQVTCTECNKISHRYENMMDLTVEIQGDAASLEDCLDQFTAQEWLDGDNMYKCDGCNDYVKACKRLTIHQAPNVLTIALKRFQSGRFGKLNKRVTFPETLNLSPYMSEPGDGTDLYRLYGVVVHIDMLNASFFGHYICYTKDFGGNWYMIDDYKVATVELEEVLSQGAYMLLYSRTSVRPSHAKPTETLKEEKQQMEVIKEDLPCLSTVSQLVNYISSEEIVPSGLTLSTEVSSFGIEDPMDIDQNFSLRVNPLSIAEYQDLDLGNPESISLGSEDLDVGSLHSDSAESVATTHIVQRDVSNSYSLGEASSSTQVHNIEPGESGNSFVTHSSFENGAMAGGNFNKDNACTVDNDIHRMIGIPSSNGSALSLRTAHEAQFSHYQSPQNSRLGQVGTAESVKESVAVQNREVKSLKVDAGSCLRANLKSVFRPGFLDKSTRYKSLNTCKEAQIEPHEASQSFKVANDCHGSMGSGSPHEGTGEDNHGGLDVDDQGRPNFIHTQLNNFIDTGDSGFDILPAEIATPVERACQVIYSSSFWSQSSLVEASCSKDDELLVVDSFKDENGVASHVIRTPICLSSQNGSHDMGTVASVPVASSNALEESNLLCLPHLPNIRLTNSKSSEENFCSNLPSEFQDKQAGLASQNGNGSHMEICEDGPVQSVNNYNGSVKSNILDPDVMVLDRNGHSTTHFMENQHENCQDNNWMANGVLSGTVKELIHRNGNAASITDSKNVCDANPIKQVPLANGKAMLSPGLHEKLVKKKCHQKDLERQGCD